MSSKATIKDIASAAGVSVATVSYVINSTPGKTVSEQTRQRVLAAAQELSYIPNNSAQRLKTKRSHCIAVRLSNNLSQPRYHNIIQGIRSYLAPYGYSILLTSFDEQGSLAGCIDACISGQADGMIYIAARGIGIRPEDMERIRSQKVLVSAVDCMGCVPDVSSVVYDYYASSRDRVDIFLQNGYRKFLYLRPKYQNYKESAREQGVRSILMERSDVSVDVIQLEELDEAWFNQIVSNYSTGIPDGIVARIWQALQEHPADTAVLCYSRELQAMVTRILYNEFLRSPSPENQDWFKRSISYQFPHRDVGVEAARALLDMINRIGTVRKVSIHPVLEFTDAEHYL